jgi:hypothetical protein
LKIEPQLRAKSMFNYLSQQSFNVFGFYFSDGLSGTVFQGANRKGSQSNRREGKELPESAAGGALQGHTI